MKTKEPLILCTCCSVGLPGRYLPVSKRMATVISDYISRPTLLAIQDDTLDLTPMIARSLAAHGYSVSYGHAAGILANRMLCARNAGVLALTGPLTASLLPVIEYRLSARLPMVISNPGGLLARCRNSARFRMVAKKDRQELVFAEGQTFASFSQRPELSYIQSGNLERARQTAVAYAENPCGLLILSGGPSSGKTHLAAAIAHTVLADGHDIVFVDSSDWLIELRGRLREGKPIRDFTRQSQESGLLILDNFSPASKWGNNRLFQLLDHRLNTGRPTIITTQLPVMRLPPRLLSRLSAYPCTVFLLEAPPYRGVSGASGDWFSTIQMETA